MTSTSRRSGESERCGAPEAESAIVMLTRNSLSGRERDLSEAARAAAAFEMQRLQERLRGEGPQDLELEIPWPTQEGDRGVPRRDRDTFEGSGTPDVD